MSILDLQIHVDRMFVNLNINVNKRSPEIIVYWDHNLDQS